MIRTAPLALLLAAAFLVGCTSTPPEQEIVRSGKNVRIERMDHLGVVEEGYWVNEETKDISPGESPDAPWQQGVARLSQPDFDRLLDSNDWLPVSTSPIIPIDLKGKLDAGDTWLLGHDGDDVYYLESDTRFVLFLVRE
ncbi:hypothetical protein ACIBSW_06260 [Actinoplanes sp. NPDC049668]|uniref:hypothetical protein n=1 Tax=unclassified Actinoplanes TaxID=2626549 RepID=UPI0033B4C167